MTTNEFIADLETKVFCRLAPSPIHGIGVFAIKPIPKGINPMEETRPTKFRLVPASQILKNKKLYPLVSNLAIDMCPQEGGVFAVPTYSLNEIGISYYLNHSKTPNMEERDGDFYTMREIKEGEELLTDYGTYCKLNL